MPSPRWPCTVAAGLALAAVVVTTIAGVRALRRRARTPSAIADAYLAGLAAAPNAPRAAPAARVAAAVTAGGRRRASRRRLSGPTNLRLLGRADEWQQRLS